MVYVTGDIHGGTDIGKLASMRFLEGKSLTRNDYVIVTGDFGINFFADNNTHSQQHKKWRKEGEYWKKWLINKPWTTLFVCGNHDNHKDLASLETVEMFGGRVGVLASNIFHLKRGEIYTIENKTFFTMGGAKTTDMPGRTVDLDWWREEIPSSKEMYYGIDNLQSHENKVNFIIAHTLPSGMVKRLALHNQLSTEGFNDPESIVMSMDEVVKNMSERYNDPTARYLQEVCNRVEFGHYYCGHFHEDLTIGSFTILYDEVLKIV